MCAELVHRRRVAKAESQGNPSLVVEFEHRPQRDVDEAGERAVRRATAAFHDVRADGDGRAPHLGDKSESLVGGKATSDLIRHLRQAHRELDDLEMSGISHAHTLSPSLS